MGLFQNNTIIDFSTSFTCHLCTCLPMYNKRRTYCFYHFM